MRVDQVELVPIPGMAPSGAGMVSRITFSDPWDAARFLQDSAEEDASDPVVRAWSLAILAATARELGEDASGSTLSGELWDAYLAALHTNVQKQIRFVHEPGEVFQSARATMALGAGDCDDHARLLYALAVAGGVPAEMLFLEEDSQPVHVVDRLRDAAGDWVWAETTFDAELGEHPLDAFARVQPAKGSDPLAHVPLASLGAILPRFVTSTDAQNLKDQLNAAVISIDRDVSACTTLDQETRFAWFYFDQSWLAFYGDKPSMWNAAAQMDRAQDYQSQISEWQSKLSGQCRLSGPNLPEPPGGVDWSAVKVLAISAAVIVAGVVVHKAL